MFTYSSVPVSFPAVSIFMIYFLLLFALYANLSFVCHTSCLLVFRLATCLTSCITSYLTFCLSFPVVSRFLVYFHTSCSMCQFILLLALYPVFLSSFFATSLTSCFTSYITFCLSLPAVSHVMLYFLPYFLIFYFLSPCTYG